MKSPFWPGSRPNGVNPGLWRRLSKAGSYYMGRVIGAVLAFFLVIGVVAGGLYWGGFFDKAGSAKVIAQDYSRAEQLVKEERGSEALMLIDKYAHLPPEQMKAFDTAGQDWLNLELQALVQTKSVPRLFHLLHRSPKTFEKHEDVILSMAMLLVSWKQWDEYEKLREPWKGRETKEKVWFLLDADILLSQGKNDEAKTLLTSKKYSGEEDIPRLIRLALAHTETDLEKAWGYLSEAFLLNPKSPEVRTFRAQILERIGKLRMARFEYAAALVADPQNPMNRDQLAEFYRRQREYDTAIATWKNGIEELSSDLMWLKTAFWARMVTSVDISMPLENVPEGSLKALSQYILSLKEGQYWNEESFRKLAEADFYQKSRPEVFWLKLLALLKTDKQGDALKLIETRPHHQESWAPELENALKQVLSYRLKGEIPYPMIASHPTGSEQENNSHILFHQLNTLSRESYDKENLEAAMPADLRDLLLSEEVWSAVFLAADWREVGLQFNRLPVIPKNFPHWVAYSLIQATTYNRGVQDALELIHRQVETPLVELLHAELLLTTDKQDEALKKLQKLVSTKGLIGFRSSLLLSNFYISKKNYEKARLTIKNNPTLAEHLMGKEQLAHLATLEGNLEEADRLYQAIEEESFTAKSYLAKRAYEQKNFKHARDLTIELIKERPDFLPLRANLKQIIDEEKRQVQQKEGALTP